MAVSIISLNINGIRSPDKRLGLSQWLRSLSVVPDVVCLQETHCVNHVECQSWFRSSGFLSVVSPGSNKSHGCIILYRPALSLVKSWSDEEGRLLQCEFILLGKTFCVVSLYAPNRNPARDLFFDEVIPFVDLAIPTVLCGDFNTVFDRSMDRRGSDASDVSRESTAALVHLFDSCCVIDTWRYLHPSSSCYTWLSPDGSVSSRIDYIGYPYVWVSSVSSCDIVPCPFSDHCAVSLSVSVPDVVPPGPSLWKLNTSVLEEEGYVHLISNFLNGWRCQSHLFPSLVKWWEMGKSRIKGLTVHYCCSRSLLFLLKGTSSLGFRHTLKTGLIMVSSLWSRPTSPSSISWLNWMLKWLKGLKCVLALVGLRKASRPALTSFAWRRNAVLIAGSLQFGMMMGPLSRLLMIFAFHFHPFAHLFLRLRPLMLLLRSLCLVMSCLRFPLTSLTRVRVY